MNRQAKTHLVDVRHLVGLTERFHIVKKPESPLSPLGKKKVCMLSWNAVHSAITISNVGFFRTRIDLADSRTGAESSGTHDLIKRLYRRIGKIDDFSADRFGDEVLATVAGQNHIGVQEHKMLGFRRVYIVPLGDFVTKSSIAKPFESRDVASKLCKDLDGLIADFRRKLNINVSFVSLGMFNERMSEMPAFVCEERISVDNERICYPSEFGHLGLQSLSDGYRVGISAG